MPLGAVAEAILLTGVSGKGASVAVIVKRALLAGGRSTISSRLPLPELLPQREPLTPEQFQVAPLKTSGKTSTTRTEAAPAGPALLISMTYMTGWPPLTKLLLLVLLMLISALVLALGNTLTPAEAGPAPMTLVAATVQV